MDKVNQAPLMLELLFGEVPQGCGINYGNTRDKVWGEAFEEWMAERGRKFKASTVKQSKLAWRRLLRERGKMPWELGVRDIEEHAAWLREKEYAATTIYNSLGIISNFYRWCDKRGVDPKCEPGFNPAARVKRPRIKRYATAKLLNRGEVRALLGILERDDTPLGRRDYAFILARLRLGVPLQELQKLQWKQIEQDEGGTLQGEVGNSARVRWRPEAERVRLPGEVWKAMRSWLAASGRLAGMQEDDYIFTPLAEPGRARETNTAEAWLGDRHISLDAMRASLKLYGQLVKIPEEKLTLQTLRCTATRLKMDEGGSTRDLKVFLNSREEKRHTKYRLGKLPQLPEETGMEVMELMDLHPPDRSAKPFKPGDGLTHGYFAKSQPEAEVLAVLAEDIRGIEEEIGGLRSLARGLVTRLKEAHSRREKAQLTDAHSQAAARIAVMIGAERRLVKEGEEDSWSNDFLAMMDELAAKEGREPVSEEVRAAVLGGEAGLTISSQCLAEEIATIRYTLRNVIEMAGETHCPAEYIRLVDIYGGGCVRLVRLLKMERGAQGRLKRYLEDMIDQTIEDIRQEEGWGVGG